MNSTTNRLKVLKARLFPGVCQCHGAIEKPWGVYGLPWGGVEYFASWREAMHYATSIRVIVT